ncbi:MAG: response regulator transcription factor [Pseudomonadales bacterium]
MNPSEAVGEQPFCDYLIVEDDVTFANTLAQALRKRGLTVYCASDGTTAMQLCARVKPQRIILDLMLGKETGLAMIQALLQRAPTAELLVLTGYSSVATAVSAIKLGACNYLCKPARVTEILNAFEQLDDNQQGYQINHASQNAQRVPSVKRLEWEHIQRVLADNNGNVSATARELSMHRRTLQRKLQKKPVQA